MSLVQAPAPEQRRPSPSQELGTNNPFRARLSGVPISPSTSDRFSFVSAPRERPQSRNPFLDVFDDEAELGPPAAPQRRANSFDASSDRPVLTGSAAELFENLTLSDTSTPMNSITVENRPPPPRPRPPPPRQKPTDEPKPIISVSTWSSNEEPRRPPPPGGRLPPSSRSGNREPSSRNPSSRDPRRRPRRNSDSSVVDAHEAEQRRRSRYPDSRSRRGEGSSKSKRRDRSSDKRSKKNAALDVIDKLDVTGIYGPGLFHHDGPFDACNPHRNKSSRRLAPVRAFPADSANNSMAGPINEKVDHSHVFGVRNDAVNDFSGGSRRHQSFDPKATVETVHGNETLGLGTSTFLDGAPASKTAIQKDLEERPRTSADGGSGGGLQRKKSLAQKIRGIGGKPGEQPRRRAPPPPGGRAGVRTPSDGRPSPTSPGDAKSSNNPFFNEYDDTYDRKGESISQQGQTSPKKPHPGISRVNTDDVSGGGNGLMKRVRSLSRSKRKE